MFFAFIDDLVNNFVLFVFFSLFFVYLFIDLIESSKKTTNIIFYTEAWWIRHWEEKFQRHILFVKTLNKKKEHENKSFCQEFVFSQNWAFIENLKFEKILYILLNSNLHILCLCMCVFQLKPYIVLLIVVVGCLREKLVTTYNDRAKTRSERIGEFN